MNATDSGHGAPVRFSRPLTALYAIAVAGFIVGAFLWAAKDDHAAPDATLDVADLMLILSWSLLVIAAVMTAMRRWASPKS